MKNKLIFILIACSVILIISGSIVIFMNNDKKSDTIEESNNLSYVCSLEEQSYTFKKNEVTISYKLNQLYYFSYDDNKISSGKKELKLVFDDIDSYNNFSFTSENSSVLPNEENLDIDFLTKHFYWFMTIPNDNNNLDEYLKKLELLKYSCEAIK